MNGLRIDTRGISGSRVEVTSSIVAAYVRRNPVPADGLAPLIASVHASVAALGPSTAAEAAPKPMKRKPAVPIHQSVTDEAIACLECGRRMKTLKRHLLIVHRKTPDQYRTDWQLPASYPLVAQSYVEARSLLSKALGLGALRHKG